MKILYLFFGVVSAVCAQQPANTGKAAAPAKPVTTRAPAKPQGITVDGVVEMVQAGLSDDLIITSLRKENKAFDLGPTDMIRLKKANVSDSVLKVMMDPKVELKPAAAASPPPPVQASPAPIVIQTPVIAGIPTVNSSGATPTAGSTASGDLNDPLTPHDSGIYFFTADRDGKPQLVVLERAAYQGSKTGGALGSALTYGIKKMKTKAVIPGPRASIRSADANPVFYFYFDDKAAGLGKSYFGVNSLSNPNQFALLKLDVAKANRETTIMEANLFGASTGTNDKSMIGFKSERIRPGLYKVVMNRPLEQGEYCFLASAGLGAYGAGAAGAADIFDFGVSVQ